MYAVIDIETTGGTPASEKITEIAIYIVEDNRITNEFVSLINPERTIPYHITQLTGITNSMVANAPKFYEIAKDIVEITEGKIFVAHNANFDYSFIKQEFKSLGYAFHREMLCTVNLSRRVFPGLASYSLGKLCKDLNIELNNRHRASGDALATVELLKKIVSESQDDIDFLNLPGIKKKDLHPNLNPEQLKKLPNKAGVYYFYNDKKELIYIGKSIDIRGRVLSHFRNNSSKKAMEMKLEISDLDFELTGNELIALLKESREIKELTPRYNRALRRAGSQFGLFSYTDSKGYYRFEIAQLSKTNNQALITFSSRKSAISFLENSITSHSLCQKLCGLYKSTEGCFHHEIKQCKGACLGKESPEDYNLRASRIISKYTISRKKFYIIEQGRADNELAVVKVDSSIYMGYGFFQKEYYQGDTGFLDDCIKKYPDDRDIRQIIRSYLQTGKPLDLIQQ